MSLLPFFLFLWQILGWCLMPIIPFLLQKRLTKNLEEKEHLSERYARPTLSRPKGRVIWIHGASIGEIRASFPLLDALLDEDPTLILLTTTATLTGKKIITSHAAYGSRLIHQFIPYDISPWNKKFLSYWRPSAVIFIENELWPGFLSLCHKRNIPFFLLNAKISAKSLQKWSLIKKSFSHLLQKITQIIPRSPLDGEALKAFGDFQFPYYGDLKEYAAPLTYCEKEFLFLQEKLKNRKIFVAASTHKGEEERLIKAAQDIQKTFPNLLMILIPRHPQRAAEIYTLYPAPLRSRAQIPSSEETLWIIDTLGELGLFFALSNHVFLGNSLIKNGGGHNPYEPLHFGCSLSTGPFLSHWETIYHTLEKQHGAYVKIFSDSPSFERELISWLKLEKTDLPPLAPQDNLPHKIARELLNICAPR